jgi:uncharacterized Zn-binding protein involved in type VI secretion
VPHAARTGDLTNHGGAVLPPVPPPPRLATVLIEGKPAAVVGGVHACVIPQHAALGPGNRVLPGVPRTVLVAGLPVALVGDQTSCGAQIEAGALTVSIGGGL